MPSIHSEGSQAATLDTEHTLATITDPGNYVLVVDLVNLVNNDAVILRIKTKITSGDASQLAYEAAYRHVQGHKNVYSVPVPSPIEFIATLEQTDGTGRTFIWAVYEL